jgi:hypothetical protein
MCAELSFNYFLSSKNIEMIAFWLRQSYTALTGITVDKPSYLAS